MTHGVSPCWASISIPMVLFQGSLPKPPSELFSPFHPLGYSKPPPNIPTSRQHTSKTLRLFICHAVHNFGKQSSVCSSCLDDVQHLHHSGAVASTPCLSCRAEGGWRRLPLAKCRDEAFVQARSCDWKETQTNLREMKLVCITL